MKKLFFKLYNPCGLFNQITSIELGVGLSFQTGRQIIWHNINNPSNNDYGGNRVPIYSANYAFNDRNGLVDKDIYPKITDLLDWNNKESSIFIDDIVETFSSESIKINNLIRVHFRSAFRTFHLTPHASLKVDSLKFGYVI